MTAGCGNVGFSHRTRKRHMFTRKSSSEIDDNNHGFEETQEDEKACKTRECSGMILLIEIMLHISKNVDRRFLPKSKLYDFL